MRSLNFLGLCEKMRSSCGVVSSIMALPSLNFKSSNRVHPDLLSASHEKSKDYFHILNEEILPSYLSAQWLSRALDTILSAYSDLQKRFAHVQLQEDNVSKWVNEHLDEMVKLLDLCNVASESLSEVKNYQMLICNAIRCLDGMEISNVSQGQLLKAKNILAHCMNAIDFHVAKPKSKLIHSCSSNMLRREMGSSGDFRDGQLFEDMNNINTCTSFVCGTLARAIQVKPIRPSDLPNGRTLPGSLPLIIRFYEKLKRSTGSKGSGAMLHELDGLDVPVRKLHHLLDKHMRCKTDIKEHGEEVKELIETLKKCRFEAEKGIAPFHSQINDLFNLLIRTRVALLDILTYSHV